MRHARCLDLSVTDVPLVALTCKQDNEASVHSSLDVFE
jgi:hypothetical protein